MAYGKGKFTNPKSGLFGTEVTVEEFITWRDGSVSCWFTFDDGLEGSVSAADITITEVFSVKGGNLPN